MILPLPLGSPWSHSINPLLSNHRKAILVHLINPEKKSHKKAEQAANQEDLSCPLNGSPPLLVVMNYKISWRSKRRWRERRENKSDKN
jgi:hypothetical protein